MQIGAQQMFTTSTRALRRAGSTSQSMFAQVTDAECTAPSTPPLWYQFKDPQDVIAKIYRFLTGMQFFENLDAFADHAINLNGSMTNGQIH
ncbi:hypothetical protein ACU8MI_16620 [Rhizobium leguminosarum]